MTLALAQLNARRLATAALATRWHCWRQTRSFSALAARARHLDPEAMMRTLPPKPEAPSNDDCCLSGCEFCVWDLYDEDMREYQKQAGAIRDVLEAQGKPVPARLRPENLRDAVGPTMRAFLDLEREMAMKIQHEADENQDNDEGQV